MFITILNKLDNLIKTLGCPEPFVHFKGLDILMKLLDENDTNIPLISLSPNQNSNTRSVLLYFIFHFILFNFNKTILLKNSKVFSKNTINFESFVRKNGTFTVKNYIDHLLNL